MSEKTDRQFESGAGGDCNLCRRNKYCEKGCTENKKRQQRLIASAFAKTDAGKMMAAMMKEMRTYY